MRDVCYKVGSVYLIFLLFEKEYILVLGLFLLNIIILYINMLLFFNNI